MFEKWGVGIYLGYSPFTAPTLDPGSIEELTPISDVEDKHKESKRKNPVHCKPGFFRRSPHNGNRAV
jgi:hypothetical protein